MNVKVDEVRTASRRISLPFTKETLEPVANRGLDELCAVAKRRKQSDGGWNDERRVSDSCISLPPIGRKTRWGRLPPSLNEDSRFKMTEF